MIVSYPRAERKLQIAKALAVRALEGKGAASMRQIATLVKMSPCGSLMDILWDMVDDGQLVADPVEWRPGWTAWHFRLSPHRYGVALDQVYEQEKVS